MRIPQPLALALSALAAVGSTPAQSIKSYGLGTPGTGGVTPRLWNASTPRPGNQRYGFTLNRARPNSAAVLLVSAARDDVRLGGLSVSIDLGQSVVLSPIRTDSSGSSSIRRSIPSISTLIGAKLYQQAFVADPGGAPIGFSATNALEVTVKGFGLLFGVSNSRQIAIRLDTGAISDTSHPSVLAGQQMSFSPGSGSHLAVGNAFPPRVSLFDCQTFPPQHVRDFPVASSSHPQSVVWHPSGDRLYVVNPFVPGDVEVFDGRIGTPTFGRPHPGGNISSVGTGNQHLWFSPDGNFAYLQAGIFPPGSGLQKIDTRLGSPTYHQVVGSLTARGATLLAAYLVQNGPFILAGGPLSAPPKIWIADADTLSIDQTYGAPAQTFGEVFTVVGDPRGRFAYVGCSFSSRSPIDSSIARIRIDRTDPKFGEVLHFRAGIPKTHEVGHLAISDAGDRLYSHIRWSINLPATSLIIEWDTETMTELRRWSVPYLRYVALR